jgi:hypothetical protein
VRTRVHVRLRREQLLQTCKFISLELGSGKRGGTTSFSRFRIGQIDPAVLFVIGMELNVEQSTLTIIVNRRNIFNLAGLKHIICENKDPAFPLRHQHPAVGQKGDSPWIFQSGCKRINGEIYFFRRNNMLAFIFRSAIFFFRARSECNCQHDNADGFDIHDE